MKRALALIMAFAPGFFPAQVFAQSIVGTWRYDGFFYEDHRYPLPNPNLELTFTFDSENHARLFWKRLNEPGFCERIAEYEVSGQIITQKIAWVNPDNLPECAADVDMQLGKETVTEFEFGEAQLGFHFELNGKPLLYILKWVEPTP